LCGYDAVKKIRKKKFNQGYSNSHPREKTPRERTGNEQGTVNAMAEIDTEALKLPCSVNNGKALGISVLQREFAVKY